MGKLIYGVVYSNNGYIQSRHKSIGAALIQRKWIARTMSNRGEATPDILVVDLSKEQVFVKPSNISYVERLMTQQPNQDERGG